jgi:hypothetical protein
MGEVPQALPVFGTSECSGLINTSSVGTYRSGWTEPDREDLPSATTDGANLEPGRKHSRSAQRTATNLGQPGTATARAEGHVGRVFGVISWLDPPRRPPGDCWGAGIREQGDFGLLHGPRRPRHSWGVATRKGGAR